MRKTMKRVLAGLGVVLLIVVAVIVVKTMRFVPPEYDVVPAFTLDIDLDKATAELSDAIQIETVSTDLTAPGFEAFLAFLQDRYPLVHAQTTREVLEPNTPLFRWEGRDPSLQPVLLAAHYDVVPVAPWSLDRWTYPAFSGQIADGYVWGRGTLDDKGALIAMLHATEHLLGQGFRPKRTVYFSFGGDEEVRGLGAQAVAASLIDQNIQLAWALDEGSFVLDNVIPGLEVPVASINLSEKGYLTVRLVAQADGGHSALPPNVTAVGRVARAVDRLQSNQMAGGLTGISAEFFDGLGPHFELKQRALFANRWLFGPVLEGVLSGPATTNAMLRTTTAPTMLSGSSKENVLATEASAVVNFRIHPRDTVADVVAHVTRVVDDENVQIIANVTGASEASPVASSQAQGYADIESSIRAVFGEIASVPGLTIAATDARHYAKAADAAYRINPFKVENDDIARFHGVNERLSIENLAKGIDFYGSLLMKQ